MHPITDTPDALVEQPDVLPDEERLYRLSYQPLLWGESPEDETPEEKVKLSLNREQFYGVLCAFDILLACDNDPDELLQITDVTNGQELEAQYLTEYSPYLLGSVMSPTAAEAFPSPVSRDKADELRDKYLTGGKPDRHYEHDGDRSIIHETKFLLHLDYPAIKQNTPQAVRPEAKSVLFTALYKFKSYVKRKTVSRQLNYLRQQQKID